MNIIITGAGKGIGFELVKKFASSGEHQIIALARDISKLNPLLNTKSRIIPYTADICKVDFPEQLALFVTAKKFNIDILINNAGLMVNKPAESLSGNDFDNLFATNVKAPFLLIQSLLPYFSKPSHIVNLGSMGGFQGSAKFKGLSLYSASKGALAILTECLAEEFTEKGIRVNCLALGAVQTEMLESAFPGYKAPMNAVEAADYIADFSLNGHRYFNGKIIPVSSSTP